MNEIKKCPFCGEFPSIQIVRKKTEYHEFIVETKVEYSLKRNTCGYEFGKGISEIFEDCRRGTTFGEDGVSKLLEHWNKRAEEPQEKKETRFERLLKEEQGADELVCCLAYRDKYKGKNCDPFNCGECEFHNPENAINYLLEPYEENDHD